MIENLTTHFSSPKLPFTRGNRNAALVFVGEAPGAEEESAFRAGKSATAFVGNSGKLLDEILRESQIDISNCYFTNVIKRHPKSNSLSDVSQSEYISFQDCLKQELLSLPNATLIVPLGNLALAALTGKVPVYFTSDTNKINVDKLSGISKWRGSILPIEVEANNTSTARNFRCIPTYHPSAIFQNWTLRVTVVADLERIREELIHPSPPPSYEAIYGVSSSEYIDLINSSLQSEYIATDIETNRLCIGVATSSKFAFCVPFQNADGSPYFSSLQDESAVLLALNKLLSTHKKQIGHFYYYDAYWYHHLGLIEALTHRFTNTYFDTFSAHVALYGELPHSLQYLTSIYTNHPYYKAEGRYFNPSKHPIEQLWLYNCKDCFITYQCFESLREELSSFNYTNFFNTYYTNLFPYLLQSMVRGIAINKTARHHARTEYFKKWKEAQEILQLAIGHEITLPAEDPHDNKLLNKILSKIPHYFNVKSSKKVLSFVQSLGVDVKSTQEKYLRHAMAENPDVAPIINCIFAVKEIRDIKSRYLDPRLGHDDRFHYTLKAATETGRLASEKDPLNYGGNCQNVPDGICRSYLVPDPGKIMIYADLAQAEARVVAYLSNCRRMILEFETADRAAALRTKCSCGSNKFFHKCCGDVHRLSAASIFKLLVSSVTDDQRSMGKKVKHASNYRMGAKTMSLNTGLPQNTCKQLLAAYFRAYPEVLIWHSSIQETLTQTRKLTNPLGRVRYFFDRPWEETTLREAIAFIPQSTIPDIVNLAYMECADAGIQVLLQAHDALLAQVYYSELDAASAFIKKSLERPIQVNNYEIIIPVDINVGLSWSKSDLMSISTFKEKFSSLIS